MTDLSRRNFLYGAAGTFAAGTLMHSFPSYAAALHNLPIGIQLYSVRELLDKNFEETLRLVAGAGYREVEAAGYYGRTPAAFSRALQNAGLRCVSTHHPLPYLLRKTDETIAFAAVLKMDYLVCSSSTRKDLTEGGPLSLDDWKWVADQLNILGKKVKAAGMQFGYHNHIAEFTRFSKTVAYDELLRLTDPSLVKMEMDCGWVVAAGFDPVDYLQKSPDRFPLLHVKDMVRGTNGDFHSTELGRGTIDYRPIFKAATGLRHYFVEQEEFDIPIPEALKVDAGFVRNLNP